MNFSKLMIAACALATATTMPAQVTINVDAGSRGPRIGDLHYGIFFEEINHAGDGGLYAELIRNRSFEDENSPANWSPLGSASISIVSNDLLDGNAKALKVVSPGAGGGVSNPGFWGINTVAGQTYSLSFYVRTSWSGTLTASLVSGANKLGSATINVKGDAGKWQKLTATITATGSAPKATFTLTTSSAGTLEFDCISLFPPTYKNRPNGCRPDLAEKLEAMHPSFVRFPGGCFVEGQATAEGNNRFEWKKTIGPIENRPGHWNGNWQYRSSDGLGFHELLQLTEDLGAEPLFVVNIGMGHGWTVPYNQIGEFIQEALDAIEYCNGGTDTKWGAVRAANGHPEPFNLRLLEIGNENYQTDANQQSDHYAERYKQFYDAIKAVYPEITLIGNVEAWGTDNPSWRNTNPCEVVDEHYYRNPQWFVNQYGKYDKYDRSKPKVYVGEYAVTDGYGTNGHLTAALGEATYMLGMERNSDVCVMNSYAPIFVNENDQRWRPDMIRFNSEVSYGTPSYHVQSMMANTHGKQNVTFTEQGNLLSTGNKIGVSTWSTTASFDNVTISDLSGNVLFSDDFSSNSGHWTSTGGTWSVSGGTLNATDGSAQGKLYVADYQTPDSYIYELDATKKSGAEAFLVAFNYGDANNYAWWNIGGWNNTQHAIEVCTNGSKTGYGNKSGSITAGKTYHLKIEVEGANVRCYIDGELIHDVVLPVARKVYFASSVDESGSKMIIKIVNNGGEAVPVNINLASGSFGAAEVQLLASANGTDENTTSNPYNVAPASGSMDSVDGSKAVYTAPAYSLSIITIEVSGYTMAPSGSTPSAADRAAVEEYLKPLSLKLKNLHSTTSLPTTTPSGASIEWSYTAGSAVCELTGSNWFAMLATPKLGSSVQNAGTLRATVTYPGGEVSTHDYPVVLSASDDMAGYLYCYMKSNKEITNFALGNKEDGGKEFHQLLEGDEVFDTRAVAEIEHGTRDAFIGRGQREGEYFITTTDMCNATSKVWSNFGLNIVRSKDLIHWNDHTTFDFRKGKSIFSDPDATVADGYKTDAEYARIHRVWAPQFIYDPSADKYLVYYSLLSSNSGDNHDRIFYSYADKDFKTLTQPRVFYDPGYSVIDADIVYNPYDGLYHMAIKHEGANGSDRGVYILTSDKLVGGTWSEYTHVNTEGSELTEGATMCRRIDEDAYNLYFMRYSGGSAYKVCDLDHLCDNFGSSVNVGGEGNFQHGSVMQITSDEYAVLQCWSDITALIKEYETADTHVYDAAIANARKALAGNTISTLAQTLPEALAQLKAAKEDYVKELVAGDGDHDLTGLLVNPTFDSNRNGWSGTGFGGNTGVAEHWNKTFDTYQILEYMPAGTYVLSCSGFYRNGGKEAYNLHTAGSEQLLADLYIEATPYVENAAPVVAEKPFMSLYDESTSYTGSPYTFPDDVNSANRAFNTNKFYGGNSVSVVLSSTGSLRLGIRKTDYKNSDWTCVDNFKLTYNRAGSGVEGIVVPADSDDARTYDLLGRPVENPAHGIYIRSGRKIVIR